MIILQIDRSVACDMEDKTKSTMLSNLHKSSPFLRWAHFLKLSSMKVTSETRLSALHFQR